MSLPGWDGGDGRRRLADDGGLTSLEMAILFPVLLLVILLMFQISLYWHTANVVGVAAEQGLDAGKVFPEMDGQAEMEAEATALSFVLNSVATPDMPDVKASRSVLPDGNPLLQVSVTARTPRLVAIGGWEVRSVAEGRFEEFVPANER